MSTEDIKSTDKNNYNYTKLRLQKKPIFCLFDEVLSSKKCLDNKTAIKLTTKYKQLQSTEDTAWFNMQFEEIRELYEAVKTARSDSGGDSIHLCEIMKHSVLELPRPSPIVRSKELESRLERLQRQAENAEYHSMTRNIGSGQPVNQKPIAKELKVLDSQIMFMFNFLVTVLAAFAFGYKATEYSLSQPDLTTQLIVGMCMATLVFFADVYFVIRDLDRDDSKLKQS